MIEAGRDAERAHLEQELMADHAAARSALRRDVGCGQPPSRLEARAAEMRAHARHARQTLGEIEALPIAEAAHLIRDNAARATAEAVAEAARQTRAADATRRHSPSPVHPPGPERGFGPSL